jgi:hypothetical protein
VFVLSVQQARVTHFPAHIESQALNSRDGKSEAMRAAERHERDRSKAAREKSKGMHETKAERARREARDKKKARKIALELRTDIPEGYEQYFS